MKEHSPRWRSDDVAGDVDDEDERESRVVALLDALNRTIYSSGEDYDRALRLFFRQLAELGRVLGTKDLDELSVFIRRNSRTF